MPQKQTRHPKSNGPPPAPTHPTMDAPPVPAIVGPDAALEFDADADTASVLTANDEPAAKKSKKEVAKDLPASIDNVDPSMSHRFVLGE